MSERLTKHLDHSLVIEIQETNLYEVTGANSEGIKVNPDVIEFIGTDQVGVYCNDCQIGIDPTPDWDWGSSQDD